MRLLSPFNATGDRHGRGASCRGCLRRCPRLLLLPIKAIYQFIQLMWTLLFVIGRPNYILIQNPPAIPTMIVARIVATLRCSTLVIDWHNFAYTLLGNSPYRTILSADAKQLHPSIGCY
jgi:hypothetical protein